MEVYAGEKTSSSSTTAAPTETVDAFRSVDGWHQGTVTRRLAVCIRSRMWRSSQMLDCSRSGASGRGTKAFAVAVKHPEKVGHVIFSEKHRRHYAVTVRRRHGGNAKKISTLRKKEFRRS